MSRSYSLILMSVLLGVLVTNATHVEALQGKMLIPIADSYVWNESPDWNRGKEWDLIVQEYAIERIVFLMFDLSQIPTGASVDEAKLRLFTNAVDIKALVSTHYCASSDWKEDEITYNNKPSFSATPTDTLNVTTALKWYEWNVTEAAQTAFSTVDKKLSLVVKADTQGGIIFRSKDDPFALPQGGLPDTRPQLSVSYVAPPPSGLDPTTIALIGIIVVGAIVVGLEIAYLHFKRRKP